MYWINHLDSCETQVIDSGSYIISTYIYKYCIYSVSQDLHSAYGIQPPEFRHHAICRSDCKRFGAADNDWAYPPNLNHCEQAKEWH